MKKNKKIDFYFWAMFLIIFIAFLFFLLNNRFIFITGDGVEYHEYFTKIFIEQNFNNGEIIKYPIGTTLLQLPFLLCAFIISIIFNIDIEYGFSNIFQKAVLISAVTYSTLGLILLYKLIQKRFTNLIASLTCFSLLSGTMLSFYTFIMPSYSHAYGFFICALFMHFVDFYERKYVKTSTYTKKILDITLGLILGFACLIRYTNILITLFYMLYNVSNFNSLKQRLKLIFSKKLIYQIIPVLFLFLFQLTLYKIQCGEFLLHGYGNEKFTYLLNPQIYKVLFSISKGLFIFCPILYIGFLAMFFIKTKNNPFKIANLAIFLLATYIFSSWWCWWYGVGYSQRLYCDILCIFAIPIASVFNLFFILKNESKKFLAIILMVILFAFVLLNIIWIIEFLKTSANYEFSYWYDLKECLKDFFLIFKL